jgi:transcriptional regulator with XRE-family HTH domain
MPENLRLLRLRANLSQRALGRVCDPPLAQETVSLYERGMRVPPGTDHVARLARALGVTPEVLTGPSVIRVPVRHGNAATA